MAIPPVRLKFARRLKQLRKKKGFTAQEAARRCKMHLREYQRLESKKPPSLRFDTIGRIVKALRISWRQLFWF